MKIVVFPGPGRRAEPGPFAVLRARGAFGWMRGAFGWVRGAFGLAAALVGSVIGAGFLSGAELVRFFPAQGILPYAAVAAGLFFLCFWMLYRVGGACGGFAGVLARLGRAGPLLRAALLASSFVLCAGMLAGLHSLAREGAGVGLSFPLPSLLPRALFGRKRARVTATPAARENSLAPAKPAARGGSHLPVKSAAPVSWRAPAKSAAPATPAARADRIPTGGGAGPPRAAIF